MKRGESGLCLIVGVDKPSGMSSHDVVNRCRRIFGERRVGHTGTLDPLASGVLPICVGPATRLDAYMTSHDKRYDVRVVFGAATDTDDCNGEVIRTGEIPDELYDPVFASAFAASLIRRSKQLPPVYSAIKVNGKKACDEARKGRIIDLEPRDIEVYEAKLVSVDGSIGEGCCSWDLSLSVSKGTYIRALARDIGNALGCPAHVGALRRTSAGALTLEDCVTLETLEEIGVRAALDPLRVLGVRFMFADEDAERAVKNGNRLRASDVALCERRSRGGAYDLCACTSGVCESCDPPHDGEIVAVIARNELAALYRYCADKRSYAAACVFQTGVIRGFGV